MKRLINSLILSFFIVYSSGIIAQKLIKFESTQPKMGTTFKITFYAIDSSQANKVIHACWNRVDELNNIFSDYLEDSEATELSENSGTNKWMPVSSEMWYVLKKSHEISILTGGTFDVTLGAVTKIWRRAIRHAELPSYEEISRARKSTSYKLIEYHPSDQKIRLRRAGLRFDFGGIAKGYTVDELHKVLMNEGIEFALVDGGGDLFIGTLPLGMPEWTVKTNGGLPEDISLANKALASSGDMFKNVQHENERFSHIIDPITGEGIKSTSENVEVVNVIAPNCMLADALATALSATKSAKRDSIILKFPYCTYFISQIDHKE